MALSISGIRVKNLLVLLSAGIYTQLPCCICIIHANLLIVDKIFFVYKNHYDSRYCPRYAFGTSMLLTNENGTVEVALTRIRTVVAALPIMLRVMAVPLTVVHVVPLFRLYSIVFETPVIAF